MRAGLRFTTFYQLDDAVRHATVFCFLQIDSQIATFVDIPIPHLSRFVDNPIRRCRRIDTTFVPICRHLNSSMSTNRHKYIEEILLQITGRFVDILLQKKTRFVDISEKYGNTAAIYFPELFRELSQLCIITYTANNVRHMTHMGCYIASQYSFKLRAPPL